MNKLTGILAATALGFSVGAVAQAESWDMPQMMKSMQLVCVASRVLSSMNTQNPLPHFPFPAQRPAFLQSD